MKRIANSYISLPHIVETDAIAINDQEFAQFMSGQKSELSKETEDRIRRAMKGHDAKMRLFLAAYAQKGVMRLARLMNALDHIDNELLTPWRVKSMDTKELIDVFSEINTEKSRMLKEVSQISGMGIDGEGEFDKSIKETTGKEEEGLTKERSARLIDFYKHKVAVNGA